MLMSFIQGLSYGTRYFRFGHDGIEFGEDEILRVCTPDPQECVHFLVLGFEGESEKIVGSGRVVFEGDGKNVFRLPEKPDHVTAPRSARAKPIK